MRPDAPLVGVIVLNWNRKEITLQCLASLMRLDYPSERLQVVLVDNASSDGTAEGVRERFPEVDIVRNDENLGYAEGNNVGMRYLLARGVDYVLILNNDTLIDPLALAHLVHAAQERPDAAFIGPKILHLDEPERIQSTGMILDGFHRARQRDLDRLDEGGGGAVEEVDGIIGAAVLASAEALEEIGFLDGDYYMYLEDIDWCLRARQRRYHVLYQPAAKVWHQSHRVQDRDLPRITYYMTRNSLLIAQRYGVGGLRVLALLGRHLLTAIVWTIRPKWRGKRAERAALLRGMTDFIHGRVGRGYA